MLADKQSHHYWRTSRTYQLLEKKESIFSLVTIMVTFTHDKTSTFILISVLC